MTDQTTTTERERAPDALLPYEPPDGTTVFVVGDEERAWVFTRDDRDAPGQDGACHWFAAGDPAGWDWGSVNYVAAVDPVPLIPATAVSTALQILASDVSLHGVPGVVGAVQAEAVVNWLLEQAKVAEAIVARSLKVEAES